MEAIIRAGHGSTFLASVTGFEYTFYQLANSNADVGLLAEFQYDGREETHKTPIVVSGNDLFLGARLALNDETSSSLLVGLVFDLTNETTLLTIEAERRISNHWKAELEARLFTHVSVNDPIYLIRRDDSITLRLTYAF